MEPWQLTFQHFHSYFHHWLRATQSICSPFNYFSKCTRTKDPTWAQGRALFISESNWISFSKQFSSFAVSIPLQVDSCVESAITLARLPSWLLLLLFLSRKSRYEMLSLRTILKSMQANIKSTPAPGSSAHSNSSLPVLCHLHFILSPRLKLSALPQSASD